MGIGRGVVVKSRIPVRVLSTPPLLGISGSDFSTLDLVSVLASQEWVGGRGSSTWVAVATLRCSLGGGREGLVKGAGFPLGVSSREGLPQFKQKLAPW